MRKAKKKQEAELLLYSARQELVDVRSLLDQAYCVFNSTADPELLETSILEIRALQAKYSHTLRSLKNISAEDTFSGRKKYQARQR